MLFVVIVRTGKSRNEASAITQSRHPATRQQPARHKARHTTRKPVNGAAVMQISKISIGKRHRRDLGDIDALAASIRDIGLLYPITVDERGRLLAGARRLAACKLLGLQQVEVRIMRDVR